MAMTSTTTTARSATWALCPLLSRSAPAADSSGTSSGRVSLTGLENEPQGMCVAADARREQASSAKQVTSRASSSGAARSGSAIPIRGPIRSMARLENSRTMTDADGT